MTARLPDPGRFSRITAVVVNADTGISGLRPPARTTGDTCGKPSRSQIAGRVVR